MKAAIYNPDAKATALLSITEIAKPTLTTNNAIIKVTGVGVCGSDLLKLNRSLVKAGTILGHEMTGVVEEISNEMSAKYNLKKGDRILSSHHVPCLKCNYCLNQQESLCSQFKTTNFNPGAFCEYLELSELHLQHTVQKIPDQLSDLEASFTEPLACCIKAVERSGLKAQSSGLGAQGSGVKVLIIGLGSIGLLIGQLVKYYKSESEITGLDLNADRLKLALELGFTHALSPEPPALSNYHTIFLCAGANVSVDLAIEAAANGAAIVVFSSVADELKAFSNNQVYYKELTIVGSYSPNLSNLKESLELISSNKIQVKDLITHTTNLENLGTNIKKLNEEKGIKLFLEANN